MSARAQQEIGLQPGHGIMFRIKWSEPDIRNIFTIQPELCIIHCNHGLLGPGNGGDIKLLSPISFNVEIV